ncbi:MAG: hypothetical protein ABXS92_02000 [Sulfurimonas sp.]
MIKQFLVSVFLLLILTGGMFLHYAVNKSSAGEQELGVLVGLTGVRTPSLSTAYYEPRIMPFQHVANPAYPHMQAINRMDIVYAE